MISRLLALVRKEFLHILRDRRTLGVMFLLPIIELVFLGYAATNDIEHLSTAVLDGDKSAASRTLIEAYRASGYFDITFYVESERELAYLMDRGQVHAGMIAFQTDWGSSVREMRNGSRRTTSSGCSGSRDQGSTAVRTE